jgi:hypothetical protein
MTRRRDFLAALATLTGAAACASPALGVAVGAAPQTPTPTPAGRGTPGAASTRNQPWDDSWFATLTSPHKAVFDSPAIEDGMAIAHVSG